MSSVAKRILANRDIFNAMIAQARSSLGRGELEKTARKIQEAAMFAWENSVAMFYSASAERILHDISAQAFPEPTAQTAGSTRGLRVLHVLTFAFEAGGHTRLCWRWIKKDKHNTHSVFITQQGSASCPEPLIESVRQAGGHLFMPRKDNDLLSLARQLRETSRDYDVVVLHVHPHDAVPGIALDNTPGLRKILLNHATHVFWLGIGISHTFVNLLNRSARTCIGKRAIPPGRISSLRIPIDAPKSARDKSQARGSLAIPDDALVIFSSGSPYKYHPIPGNDFFDLVSDALVAHPNVHLVVAGPTRDAYWQRFEDIAPGRIRTLGYIDERRMSDCYVAADIYIDSAPFLGGTSNIEASFVGLPVMTYCPQAWRDDNLCFDSDGVPEHLYSFNDQGRFITHLDRLIVDRDFRVANGKELGGHIERIFDDSLWGESLKTVYAEAFAAPPPQLPENDPPPWITAIDIALQQIADAKAGRGSDEADAFDPLTARADASPEVVRLAARLCRGYRDAEALVNETLATKPVPARAAAAPRPPSPLSALDEIRIYEEVEALVASNEKAEAIRLLEGLAAADTLRWEVYNDLGTLFFEQQDYDRAIGYLKLAIGLEFSSSHALRNLITACVIGGRIGDALAACHLLLGREPEDENIPTLLRDLVATTDIRFDDLAWADPGFPAKIRELDSLRMEVAHYRTIKPQTEFFSKHQATVEALEDALFRAPAGEAPPPAATPARTARPDDPLFAISPKCEMYAYARTKLPSDEAARDYYFGSGKNVADHLIDFLRQQGLDPARLSALDFACGYGRVTRWLSKAFATTTASDLEPSMIEFVGSQFGVETFLSDRLPETIEAMDRRFDVVFVFSLFTHLPEPSWRRWASALFGLLKPGGHLVFSTHSYPLFATLDPARYADPASWTKDFVFWRDNETRGRLSTDDYGGCIVTPRFVDDVFRKIGGSTLTRHFAMGEFDRYHDIYAVRREGGASPRKSPETFSNPGYCAWCESETVFTATGAWLRDQYVCTKCGSIPRQRALMAVLKLVRPDWRKLSIHESSPSAGRILDKCPRYSCSYFFDGVEPGTMHNGFRCENLEAMTFEDGAFDLFITQDVFEHVFDPERAFREIERVLADGGMHVFTTPVHKSLALSQQRATMADGKIIHLLPAEYHGNPISEEGSLVTWDYGQDMDDLLARWCGYRTSRYVLRDRSLGLDGEYLDVFVTTKSEANRIGTQAA